MNAEAKNTYHYNVLGGVTPADHSIQYDLDVIVSDTDRGDYHRGVARLEIENQKSFSEYLEDISGHYVEGVDSWQEAHEHLVYLLPSMMDELVGRAGFEPHKEYTAIINESYADGAYIDYYMDYDPEDGCVRIGIDASKEIEDKVLSRDALEQMLSIRA